MERSDPVIIQGGMGVNTSSPELARAVSMEGQLGTVSGTGAGVLLSRMLQTGNEKYLESLMRFPDQEMAKRIADKWYIPGGKKPDVRFKPVPMWTPKGALPPVQELVVAGNFVIVDIAKHGHDGLVAINFLEKIQRQHLLSFYGAMLGGVDYMIMGAGLVFDIPGYLQSIYERRPTQYKLDVKGATREHYEKFDPSQFSEALASREINLPKFLAIVTLDFTLKITEKKKNGPIYGYVIENPTAGGHNAPPRGMLKLDEKGQPLYGEKDKVNYQKVREAGVKFWLAGSWASPEGLSSAWDLGAVGIQAGSIFSLSNESGMREDEKAKVREQGYNSTLEIFTSAVASPTNFPIKIVLLPGTMGDQKTYDNRKRICDLGRLQELVESEKGNLILRCPAEPEEDYLEKGGKIEDTVGRMCLCNTLFAAAGLPQNHAKYGEEQPVITQGDDHSFLRSLMNGPEDRYSASDVIKYILNDENIRRLNQSRENTEDSGNQAQGIGPSVGELD